MTDFVLLQNDIEQALLSRAELGFVNVKQYRKMMIQSEIDMKLIYLAGRSGKTGAGIVVEMPELTVTKPNVAGPVLECEFPILVMEQPQVNLSSNGTRMSAETICQYVQDTLHHMSLGFGSLVAGRDAIKPATEFQGVVAYRCRVGFTAQPKQTQRTGLVQITATSTVALACSADPTAGIWYTLDGSFPTNSQGANPQSHYYSAPLALPPAGTLLRTAAYLPGKIGSSVMQQQF